MKRFYKRRLLRAMSFAVLLLAFAFAAMAQNAPERRKIALLLPLSGAEANLGNALLRASVMALFDAGDVRLALIPYDTGGRADQAALMAERARADGAALILGPLFSSEIKGAAKSQLPVLSYSNDWSQAGGNVFVLGLAPQAEAAQIIAFLQQKGVRVLHILTGEGAYAKAVSDSASAAAARSALKLATVATYSTQQPQSLDRAIAKIKSALPRAGEESLNNFHAVLLADTSSRLPALNMALEKAGILARDIAIAGTSQWIEADFSQLSALQGGFFAAPAPSLLRQMQDRYQAQFGAKPPFLTAVAYDAARIGAFAVGQDNPGGVMASLRQSPVFPGLTGNLRFTPEQAAERQLSIIEATASGPRLLVGN